MGSGKIGGYILIVLSCLAFALNLVANLLEGKLITSDLILSLIGSVCFFVLGIMLIKKDKIKEEKK